MKGEPVFSSMNILPNFRITDGRKEDKITNWNVRTSFLPSRNLPFLGVDMDHVKNSLSRSQTVIKYNTLTLPPPNDRYINNNNYSTSNPSPLGSLARRCSAEPSMIVVPEELTREVKIRKPLRNMKHLVIGVHNLSLTLRRPLELFVQKSSSTIHTAPVKSGRYISRIICGQLSRNNVPENNLLLCATCHLGTSIVYLPPTKMMVNFRFMEGPIGLELENCNDHVICNRVVPLSQAAAYRDTLVGAEIVAVNNRKISSLDDYRNLISQCDVGEVALRAVVTRPVDSVTARRKLADNWLQKSKLESVYETANNGHHENNLEARKASNLTEVCQSRSIYRGEDENLISVVTKMRRQLDLCENEDESKSPTWNYATATDTPQSEAEEEVDELAIESVGTEGSMHIAYMPTDALMCSKSWGNPKSLLQISNLSVEWSVSIYWVDEDGVLIFRKKLNTGERHMEMTSGNHLWAMCAESVSDVAPETHLQSFPSIESATLCLFRPCETSLLRAKCVSLLWVPNSSLTVSQREIHPFEHLRRSDARTDLRRTTPSSSDPLMHVQIL